MTSITGSLSVKKLLMMKMGWLISQNLLQRRSSYHQWGECHLQPPFIAIGEIGKGKLMMVGNARYNNTLVSEWFHRRRKCRCSRSMHPKIDADNMKHFFRIHFVIFLLLIPSENQKIRVGTNLPYVYFSLVPDYDYGKFSIGTQADFKINETAFNAETVKIQSGGFSE